MNQNLMYRQFLRQMHSMFDPATQTQIRRRIKAALAHDWDEAFLGRWDPRGAEGADMHPGRVILECYLGDTQYTLSEFRAFCFDRGGKAPDALLAGKEKVGQEWAAKLAGFFDFTTEDSWLERQALHDSYLADFK